jgi:acetylornithine deacetylase/succinyl-diaminopimelate desuccinylase-like protein
MRQKIVLILSVVLVWLILGSQSENVETNDDKSDIISKTSSSVAIENIFKTVEELQNFETRYSWKKQNEVANYLFKKFQEYDIPVEFDEYYFRDKKWKNVVATIHGRRKPEDIYMVIAHFDSISKQPEISAPGADDNASGTAAVLEIARILKDVQLDSSIQFGIFSNEEQDGLGSKHFAKKARKQGLRIKGCINLDVIGYNGAMMSPSGEASKRKDLIGIAKLKFRTARNQIHEYLHPNGIVIIAGRPQNESLVKVTSSFFNKYSNIGIKEIVGEDCG